MIQNDDLWLQESSWYKIFKDLQHPVMKCTKYYREPRIMSIKSKNEEHSNHFILRVQMYLNESNITTN